MEKEPIITRTPTPRTVPPRTETPVRTLPMDEAKRLIRKVYRDHEGLFRRLAESSSGSRQP
jgi:hypothetical protein